LLPTLCIACLLPGGGRLWELLAVYVCMLHVSYKPNTHWLMSRSALLPPPRQKFMSCTVPPQKLLVSQPNCSWSCKFYQRCMYKTPGLWGCTSSLQGRWVLMVWHWWVKFYDTLFNYFVREWDIFQKLIYGCP